MDPNIYITVSKLLVLLMIIADGTEGRRCRFPEKPPFMCYGYDETDDKASCYCEKPYYLDLERDTYRIELECGTDGRWSPEVKCVKDCPELKPALPLNCTISGNKYRHTASCECPLPKGKYYMEGSSFLKCDTEGRWSAELPKCRRACPLLKPVEPLRCSTNGSIYKHGDKEYGYKHGAYVNCGCSPTSEYDTVGATVFECGTDGNLIKHPNGDGHWDGELPTCEKRTTTTASTTTTSTTTTTTTTTTSSSTTTSTSTKAHTIGTKGVKTNSPPSLIVEETMTPSRNETKTPSGNVGTNGANAVYGNMVTNIVMVMLLWMVMSCCGAVDQWMEE